MGLNYLGRPFNCSIKLCLFPGHYALRIAASKGPRNAVAAPGFPNSSIGRATPSLLK